MLPLSRSMRLVVAAALVVLGCVASSGDASARGGPPAPDVLDADDPALRDDLERAGLDLVRSGPSDEDVVLAAQKVRTTIQEAPSIITVVTRRQIQERGYRTINEVLRTIPGFEGDRWEGNGWQKEAFARGNPQTVLVLLNGVNIVEPIRNTITLDRKIPLEIVERIEITSGPGGVLWGSNALLGVVNIVTRRPDDSGFHAVFGGGDGPGERLALKAGVGGSHKFSDDVGVFVHFDFFSTRGPELTMDQQKVIGALPEPAPDGPTLYLPRPETVLPQNRSWWFNASGRLELGPIAIDWMLPFEEEYRAIATGGSNLGRNYLTGDRETGVDTRGSDAVRMANISYRDRFAEDAVGLSARAYIVSWQIREDPFGVYAASPLTLASQGHARDIRLALIGEEILRPGTAVDLDWRITKDLTLLTGAEFFADINRGVNQTSWAADTLGTCPEGFTYNPLDPHLRCSIVEPQVTADQRLTGGAFAQLDWKVDPRLALSGGARLQVSSQFGAAMLWSGGAVWKVADDTHLKLFGSSGLRPPSVVGTNVNPQTASGVSFQPNPSLRAETSQSIEMEFNTTVLRDTGVIRDLFLRANGAFTLLENVIGRPAGVYQNSGARQIASAEAWARLRFDAGHELWATYAFTKVFDDDAPGGELLNFSQHIANAGFKLSFLDESIELTGLLTWKSGMKDANRPGILIDGRPDYSMSCGQILGGALPSSSPLYQACQFPGMNEGIWVFPGFAVMESIRPLLLLDLGVRFRNIWRDMTVAIFMHNVLNHRYFEPDFFNDDRVISRPQPKPGMSFFGQISMGL